jgi:hypothetical protein
MTGETTEEKCGKNGMRQRQMRKKLRKWEGRIDGDT